ncbi:MAG: endonuclease III [Clostridiales bacterium]|nr:endonuclease III [Clostridiales bacterium]
MRTSRKQLASLTWDALCEAFPGSECTLDNDTPERLAIRGILSAQCTDTRVNLTCVDLFGKYPDMHMLSEASEEEIGEIIRPCGLTKMKSKSVKAFSTLFVNEWGGKVPTDIDALMKCPGVGKKIANLIVGEIYGIPAIVVDTHCKRVMKRIGITDNEEPLKVEADLMKVFPEETWISLGHKAVDLGRSYCDARNPKCDICPLTSFCRKRIKT